MHRYSIGIGLQRRVVARPCVRQAACRPVRAVVRPVAYRTSAKEAGLTPEQVMARQKKYENEYNAVSSRLTGVVRRAINASVTDLLLRQHAAHHAQHHPASTDAPADANPSREVGGISSQLWAATERVDRATGIGRRLGAGEAAEVAATARQETDEEEAPEDWSSATPCDMAAAFMRCMDEQMRELQYGTGADEEADELLVAFPSSALLSSSGGGVQGVIEKVAQATSYARGPAGPAAVRALRSLAAAVGRIATQPNVYVARDKASAVMTCLTGVAEALEGAVRHTTTATGAADPEQSPTSSVDFWAEYVEYAAQQRGTGHTQQQATEAESHESGVSLEAAALLREAAAVLDCIASKSCDISPRKAAAAHNAPTHPLMSLLETRLFAAATWRSDSAAETAASLVDLLAYALSPARAGNTLAPSGREARAVACGGLRAMAGAQKALAVTLREHDADPASASRMLAALAEALGAAAIARDTFNPSRGPRPVAMFGEAQLLAGLSRMCTGEAMAIATQSHDSINITPSDASLVLEVLAEQGRSVAEAHREQISQVLKALRAVPTSLRELAQLPGELLVQQQAAAAAAAARAARRAASTASGSAAETLNLLRRTAAGYGPVAAAGAAAAVAHDTQSGVGGTIAQQQQQQQQPTDPTKSS
ncbi:hypothetical protein HXX76_007285 [Chlamydomonas incerta]|uniref:Uncharacterized protein n=1 Tax=Chlamydomonas incerta TaxID=51695 RepID=A0A835SXN7_CHLIN|nr:hypothetical protein HXX76_007285 [Chlamydomonas incerta]|eukprot:KAG2435202.1 hypothetical protein HXX76_007285 [Chlamydomonas incerta]